MNLNFEEMSKAELKAYVQAHREDDEAIRVLFSRRNPPDSEATWYGPFSTPEGVSIEENIRIAEEAIRKRAEIDTEKQRKKELQKEQEMKSKIRQEIETELEVKIRQRLEKEMEEKIRREIAIEKDE